MTAFPFFPFVRKVPAKSLGRNKPHSQTTGSPVFFSSCCSWVRSRYHGAPGLRAADAAGCLALRQGEPGGELGLARPELAWEMVTKQRACAVKGRAARATRQDGKRTPESQVRGRELRGPDRQEESAPSLSGEESEGRPACILQQPRDSEVAWIRKPGPSLGRSCTYTFIFSQQGSEG